MASPFDTLRLHRRRADEQRLADLGAALDEIARVLRPDGLPIACLTRRSALGSRAGHGRVALLTSSSNREDLLDLAGRVEAGTVVPVIDRCYPLAETGEATRRVGE